MEAMVDIMDIMEVMVGEEEEEGDARVSISRGKKRRDRNEEKTKVKGKKHTLNYKNVVNV